jgi:hypothetical protein
MYTAASSFPLTIPQGESYARLLGDTEIVYTIAAQEEDTRNKFPFGGEISHEESLVVNSIGIDISKGCDKLLESQLLNRESRVAMSIVFDHLQVLRMNVCVPLPSSFASTNLQHRSYMWSISKAPLITTAACRRPMP